MIRRIALDGSFQPPLTSPDCPTFLTSPYTLDTSDSPDCPRLPLTPLTPRYDQGREEGAVIDDWEDPKLEIYHTQDRCRERLLLLPNLLLALCSSP